jgi:mannose-6-phosphate isomerase class I
LAYSESLAERLLRGDAEVATELAGELLAPRRNNFVERPWGGTRIRRFKGFCELPRQLEVAGMGLGEAFEIAAYDEDAEAAKYPSKLLLRDGSEITLPQLLAKHGKLFLGPEFEARYGPHFPLLPKTLDIRELLSVQGHPQGCTEVYVIIEAEPGATIRIGFGADVNGAALRKDLTAGLERQRELLGRFATHFDAHALQAAVGPWLATRSATAASLEASLRDRLLDHGAWPQVAALLTELKALYWRVLDGLNVIPVTAGQIIHNATPARLLAGTDRLPSAEVHALGNPEAREILALEIRRPGPTFRAWDNVRFPLRNVDVDEAIAALNLKRTTAADFIVEPRAVRGRPGIYRSVDSEYFRVEHLRPTRRAPVTVPRELPHSLHVIAGEVVVVAEDGRKVGALARGESALVPNEVGAYAIRTETTAELVKASLPLES